MEHHCIKVSGAIGVVGGVVDILAGLVFLQQPMETQPMVESSSIPWTGYFLLGLGLIVFLSGLCVLTARMMKSGVIFGSLMFFYGTIMLALGLGMLGQMFYMMQGSMFSGIAMIVVGLAMLYSGYDMTRM